MFNRLKRAFNKVHRKSTEWDCTTQRDIWEVATFIVYEDFAEIATPLKKKIINRIVRKVLIAKNSAI